MRQLLLVVTLLIAAFFIIPSAQAQCLMDTAPVDNPSTPVDERAAYIAALIDVVPGAAVADRDLNEWAFIFHDLRQPACDKSEIRGIFLDKLKAQAAPTFQGGFTGFLSGGIVSFAYASGSMLGARHAANPAMNAYLQEVDYYLLNMPWDDSVSIDCGFVDLEPATGFPNWRQGNACMDDYALISAGYAWRSLYFKNTNRSRWIQDKNNALFWIGRTLTDLERSICIYDPSLGVKGPGGPCNSTIAALSGSLPNGPVHVISLNHGMESTNYGIGLTTSLAHAFVALQAMGELPDYKSDPDIHTVMTALFLEGQRSAISSETWAPDKCYRPTDPPGTPPGQGPADIRLTEEDFTDPHGREEDCSDRREINYYPGLYPVRPFYEAMGFNTGNQGYGFTDDPAFFSSKFDLFGTPFRFLGAARYEIYRTVAHDWWVNGGVNRPGLTFNRTFENVCQYPAPIVTTTPRSEFPAGYSGIVKATIPAQPPGTKISWEVYNTAPDPQDPTNPDKRFLQIRNDSNELEFRVGCDAPGFGQRGNVLVFATVETPNTTACPSRIQKQGIVVPVRLPTVQIIGENATITAGDELFISVLLTGIGQWRLVWSDGLVEFVTATSEERPYLHQRRARPDQTTIYEVDQVITTTCELVGQEGGLEYGSMTVTVLPKATKATPIIEVADTVVSAGMAKELAARLSSVGGPYVRGAVLEFYALGKLLGTATTDINGRASLVATVDNVPGLYTGGFRVRFNGNNSVDRGEGRADLTIACDDSIIVAPLALNLPAQPTPNSPLDYTFAVKSSQYCPWTPQLLGDASTWIAITQINGQTPWGSFSIHVEPLSAGSRSARIRVGLKDIVITQSASCTYSFSPSATFLEADNNVGAISVMDVVTQPGCSWSVTESSAWVTLLDTPVSGTGNGRARFTVGTNSGDPREADLVLRDGAGNEAARGFVNQYAPPPCTAPALVQDLPGSYDVYNGLAVSLYPVFEGTNLTYTIFVNGVPEVVTTTPSIYLEPGHAWYPARGGVGTDIRVVATNECGGASTGTVRLIHLTPLHPCSVPQISVQPGIYVVGSGFGVPLSVWMNDDPDGTKYTYQWYYGFPPDTQEANKVFNGNTRSITVFAGQNQFYFATVDDPADTCGAQVSEVGAVYAVAHRKSRAVRPDFTGDNRSDLVFHNVVSGQNEVWQMINGQKDGQSWRLPDNSPAERIQSIGDLNGDEKPDLIVRNPETGAAYVWTMFNTFRFGVEQILPSRSGAEWSIGAVADFDDDQNDDIVWHNDVTGETEIWFQNGTQRAGQFTLPSTGKDWGLHGAQDFTLDGKPDLFFYNRVTGQASVWVMEDGKPVSATSSSSSSTGNGQPRREPRRPRMTPQSLGTMQDPNFLPAAVADFTGEGYPDIVWRHKTSGEHQMWVMSGTTHVSTKTDMTDQPDLTWQSGGGGSTTGNGGSGGGSTGGTATSLTVSAEPAAFNGAAIVTAALASGNAPLSGSTLVFALNGATKATLRTDSNGTAVAAISVAGLAAGTHANAISVRFEGDSGHAASNASVNLVVQPQQAALTWAKPAPITYGTPLSATQLNATAPVPGTFVYSPPAGTILDAGNQALDVTFTPSDSALAPMSRSVVLLVNKAPATVTWPQPAPIYYGTPLSPVQLNAATTAPGSLVYSPPSGTILAVGTYTLRASFVPAFGADNYDVQAASTTIAVLQGTQTIQWFPPTEITYGTALSPAIFNATIATTGAAAAGALTYTPSAGTVLPAGIHTLTAYAAPTQYLSGTSKSVQITVNRATPVIQWPNPASIVYGTALSAAQLNATANLPGTFSYSPGFATVLPAGTHTLTVTFNPSDAVNYEPASRSLSIVVTKAAPVITWASPAPIVYGTALSPVQLAATANVAGSFVYDPAPGTILNAGSATLSVQFTPSDTANYNQAGAATTINVAKAIQTLSWPVPAPIVYGAVLSQTQLNATVSVPGPSPAGTLTYDPPAGTLLPAGNGRTLTVSAAATPNYNAASTSVAIDVLKAKPVIAWATPAPIVYRTALGAAQLNATANVAGSFVYTPAAGTVLEAGLQTLSAHLTPSDANNYEPADASVALDVQQATPRITWNAPAGIVYGTALSTTQLDATADVPGAFVYTPAPGTILDAGAGRMLSVAFTPSDTRNFTSASATTTIDVAKAEQALAWTAPASIVYGTPLSSAQLDATVSVVGPAAASALVYSPAAGTVLDAGIRTLTVTAPATSNYNSSTMSVQLEVTLEPLTLVVDPKSKPYGGAVPPLTGTLTGVVNGDVITPSYATTGTLASPAGTYPITATLIDPNHRLVNYSVTIVPSTLAVLPAPLRISADPKSKQYSDPLPALTATFTGLVLGETPSALSGLLVIETTATRLSAPGTYPISIGGLASPNYAIVYVNSTFTVTQEDARVAITSPLIVSTTAAKPAAVTMTATIRDLALSADANGDVDPGDIRHATLAFVDRATNTVLCTAPVGLVSASDERVGVATCTFMRGFATLPASLTVGARVGGYYTRDAAADDATVSVVVPTAATITAGGALTVASSAGSHAPEAGGNFTLNANLQYDKNGAVKGNFTFTFTRAGRNYELTTAATSLAIVRTATGGKAAILGDGTLRDVTVVNAPVVIATAPLVITATDAGEPSTNDAVSVALMNAEGGFWLATGWNGASVVEQNLRDGNIAVHSRE